MIFKHLRRTPEFDPVGNVLDVVRDHPYSLLLRIGCTPCKSTGLANPAGATMPNANTAARTAVQSDDAKTAAD
jgi:hypothetical protein